MKVDHLTLSVPPLVTNLLHREWNKILQSIKLRGMFALLLVLRWSISHVSLQFPFASEMEYGYTLEYAAKELKEAGDLAKKFGHRLTTHPGQFSI